ncbi:5'-adenylylsulfate reductase-like 5 isoform X3 [Cornus florida]|uniref:5'-adenylylsulfate reductase-like 5 isoform X3 n=1 Tax=Cornus florida TaxID=4283 RepID=UPI0028A0CB29|nr:5'-adenylylsulfate reductase-like 5 isoform X3 [Cornus florida]
MATSTPYLLFICICAVYALRRVSSSSISMCPHQSSLFINALRFQCPLSFPPNSPLQVDGDFLDRTLTSIRGNVQTSVLFYASWCPFSRTAHSKFEALASMFPQIDHLAVEQSSAMPSVISRYGIHGLPTILIVNQTSRTRFCGSKDLRSLVKFYEKTTGLLNVDLMGLMLSWGAVTASHWSKRQHWRPEDSRSNTSFKSMPCSHLQFVAPYR